MNDMSFVIAPKSDQINADDLIAGPMTITITDVQIRGGQEQPVSIGFEGSDKAFRPCKSMSRVLVAAWGADAKVYVGRSLTLYRDASVKWGGMAVGGIRISHMTHIPEKLVLALTATKGQRKPYVIEPLRLDAARQDDGIDAARNAIASAPDMDTLKAVWSSKAMAPFRDALKSDLEARKAALTPNDGTLSPDNPTATEGRDDADMGEDTRGGE